MAEGGISSFFGGWRPPTHPAFPAFRNSPPPTQPFAVTFQRTHRTPSLNSLCGGGGSPLPLPPVPLPPGPFQTLRFVVTFQTHPIPSLNSLCNPNFAQFFGFLILEN